MQGDWNGDNVTDLASISVGENLLQLWKGKGDGTFENFRVRYAQLSSAIGGC